MPWWLLSCTDAFRSSKCVGGRDKVQLRNTTVVWKSRPLHLESLRLDFWAGTGLYRAEVITVTWGLQCTRTILHLPPAPASSWEGNNHVLSFLSPNWGLERTTYRQEAVVLCSTWKNDRVSYLLRPKELQWGTYGREMFATTVSLPCKALFPPSVAWFHLGSHDMVCYLLMCIVTKGKGKSISCPSSIWC